MRRPEIFGRGQALAGDRTTTGAYLVSTLTSKATTDHRGMVRRDDPTTVCPKCGKPGTVAEGEVRFNLLGKPIAVDGHRISCGCPAGSNRIIAPLGPLSSIGTMHTPVETYNSISTPAPQADESSIQQQFDLQFILTDLHSGKPTPKTPYRIVMENGQTSTGVSDQNGLTEKISANSPLKVTIEAPYYESSELTAICTDTCQH